MKRRYGIEYDFVYLRFSRLVVGVKGTSAFCKLLTPGEKIRLSCLECVCQVIFHLTKDYCAAKVVLLALFQLLFVKVATSRTV